MIWLLGGYLWLYVHRPFEIWSELGMLQIERAYMLLMLAFWLAWPNKRLIPSNTHLALGMLFGVIWISWMLSPYPAQGEPIIENYAKVMVFYVLLVTSVRNEPDLGRLLRILCFSYAIYLLHSLREYIAGRYGFAQGVQRMMGVDVTFSDPNQFATCVLLSLPFVLALLRSSEGLLRGLLLVQIGLTGICILLTCSRAGIIGFGFFLFLWVCFSRQRIVGFALLLLVALLVTAALPGYVYNRIMTLVDPEAGPITANNSAAGRIMGLLKGFEIMEKYPFTGVGPGAFGAASARGFQAHNLYGQVAGELGFIGIVALTFFLGMFFWNWWQAARLAREQPWLQETLTYRVLTAVGMGVLMLMLNGMAGHTLYRYNWVWLAAFQVVALRVLQDRAAAVQPVWEPPLYPVEHQRQPEWSY